MNRKRTKRHVSTFSLSFLDIMACGLGAVTLLFLILKHDSSTAFNENDNNPNISAELKLLNEDIRIGKENQVALRNSLKQSEQEIVVSRGLADRILEQLKEKRRELGIQSDPKNLAQLQKEVEELEQKIQQLREQDQGSHLVKLKGQGDRQYLTGLKLGGNRILILVDASASMLDDTLVNIIRRRNMSDASKLKSIKWQHTIRTVEWLVAQLPKNSRYQIYTFSSTAKPSSPGTRGQWLETTNRNAVNTSLRTLRSVIPAQGTSLLNAFGAIHDFSLKPDNVFLITDGLPTQGKTRPGANTVSGKARVKLFKQAVATLPSRLPVNVILMPMEGDPEAAGLFWQLGLTSRGAFLSPARDWP